MSCLRQDTSCQSLYPVDEEQFQTLPCVVYTTRFSSVVKLDVYIRALVLDHILARKKLRVRLAYILFLNNNNHSLQTIPAQNKFNV